MSHLVSYSQIEGNLRRTAKNGLISLLNQRQLEDLALKYFKCVNKETGQIGYQCPYSGQEYYSYENIVLEHIIPVISKGGTVLFNCIPTSEEVNKPNQKGVKHLIAWWVNSKYWDKDAPYRLEKMVNYMLDGYEQVFTEYTIDEIENSYLEIEQDEKILEEQDDLEEDKRKSSQLIKEAKENGIHSYLGFIIDCINTLDKCNINTSSIKERLQQLQNQNIFSDIDKYQLYQNIIQNIVISRIGDNNSSYLTYTINFDIKKLMDSINLENEQDIYNELNRRLQNIEQLLKENNLSTIEYFKSLKDIQDIDIIYKNMNEISSEEINVFLENIKLGVDTKIEIFINMLNKSNSKILKQRNNEILDGYPNIKLANFWSKHQDRIKTILFEQEKENLKFESARQIILTYFKVGSYEELISKQNESKSKMEIDLDTKIEIFIDMLNKGNSKIIKQMNNEILDGYPNIKLANFWNNYQDKIKLILFEQEKENTNYESARQTILTYFKVGSYEELITKQEIDLDTKIAIFIGMLNKGNEIILKKRNNETLEGYSSISLSYFWQRYQDIIKTILFEQEKENTNYESARQTILTYFKVGSYEELTSKHKESKSKIEIDLDTKIKIFIDMLNKGRTEILTEGNKETLEGYSNIPLSQFWHNSQEKIKKILFKDEKENPKFEIARQTILTYFQVGSYEELEFVKNSNLHLRITCFIKMLNEGNCIILKNRNTETFKGYPNTPVGKFWHKNKNREIIIQTLFYKLKNNPSYDTARELILKKLKVDAIEEYYEKIEKESKKMKENKKLKKELEETIKMVDDIYVLLNNDEEQRKRA